MSMDVWTLPKPDLFDKAARNEFSRLITIYNYSLTETEQKVNFVEHIYVNKELQKRIEIKNATWPSDYGFSVFIWNLTNQDYNILYNVLIERQDVECEFLKLASDEIFASKELMNLITSEDWQQFGRIYFKK